MSRFFGKKKSGNYRGRRGMNILETRVRVRSDMSRRTKRLLVGWTALFTVAVISWGAWKLLMAGGQEMFSKNPQFVLKRVTIENSGAILSDQEILKYAGVRKGQNLFQLDLKTVRSNLELLPVVKNAEVRRALPDLLKIRVVERTAVARVTTQKESGWATYEIDPDGYIMNLEARPDLIDGLPLITGAKISDLRVGSAVTSPELFSALELLQKCELTTLNALLNVDHIDVSRSHMLVVRNFDGMKVKIGLEYMDHNLRRLEYILNDARRRGLRVLTADLTVDRDVPVVFRRAA